MLVKLLQAMTHPGKYPRPEPAFTPDESKRRIVLAVERCEILKARAHVLVAMMLKKGKG